jgi:hypothetical protein
MKRDIGISLVLLAFLLHEASPFWMTKVGWTGYPGTLPKVDIGTLQLEYFTVKIVIPAVLCAVGIRLWISEGK